MAFGLRGRAGSDAEEGIVVVDCSEGERCIWINAAAGAGIRESDGEPLVLRFQEAVATDRHAQGDGADAHGEAECAAGKDAAEISGIHQILIRPRRLRVHTPGNGVGPAEVAVAADDEVIGGGPAVAFILEGRVWIRDNAEDGIVVENHGTGRISQGMDGGARRWMVEADTEALISLDKRVSADRHRESERALARIETQGATGIGAAEIISSRW